MRSGKEIENVTYSNPPDLEMYKPSKVIYEILEPLNNEPEAMSEEKRKETKPYQTPTPFLQRLRLPTKGTSNVEIYKLFEQVKINIPLLDDIKQIPAYTKYLKDLCTVKCTLQVQKKVFLMEQAISIIKTTKAPKYNDHVCSTIFIVIGAT